MRFLRATHLVVLARYQGTRVKEWLEAKIEGWLELEINREKTRVVNLKEEGASLDFLGYTFRYDQDRWGRARKYLNVSPSEKAQKREWAKLHEMTDRHQCFKPLPTLIQELNRHLQGWKNYFSYGYLRKAFREINTYVRDRLTQHMRRRSQRPFRPPGGTTYEEHFRKWACSNCKSNRATACACLGQRRFQESRMREICTSGSTRGK